MTEGPKPDTSDYTDYDKSAGEKRENFIPISSEGPTEPIVTQDTPVSGTDALPEGTIGTGTILVTDDEAVNNMAAKSRIKASDPRAHGLKNLADNQGTRISDIGKQLREDKDK